MEKVHLGDEKVKIDPIQHRKMIFIYNALDDGWSIKKRKDAYIFTKNHEDKKEILEDSYLLKFMKENFDIKNLLP